MNEKAYGWVMALASRDDGLFGQIKTNSSDIDYDRACQQIKTENPALFAAIQNPSLSSS